MAPPNALRLLGLALVCALVLLVLGSIEDAARARDPAAPGTSTSHADARGRSAARLQSVPDSPVPGQASVLEPATRHALAPDQPAGSGEALEGQTGAVLVLDGLTGTPVVGARVTWIRGDRVPGLADAGPGRRLALLDEQVERAGNEVRTDGRGRARVELGGEGGFVRAAWRGRSQSDWVAGAGSEARAGAPHTGIVHTLRLFPVRALEIQVVDGSGRARQNVEVCLRMTGEQTGWQGAVVLDASQTGTRPVDWVLWSGRTVGPDGVASIADFHAAIVEFYEFRARPEYAKLRLCADFELPRELSAAVWFDPGELGLAPVVLTLPDVGTVTIEVLGGSARVLAVDGLASLEQVTRSGSHAGRPGRSGWRTTTALRGGVARFEAVPLGLELEASVRFEDGRGELEHEFEGPRGAEPATHLRLTAPAAHTTLSATLRDAEGRLLASSWVSLVERTLGPTGAVTGEVSTPCRTGPRAELEARLRLEPAPGERHEVLVRFPHTPSESPAEARETLLRAGEEAHLHLGTLRLRAP